MLQRIQTLYLLAVLILTAIHVFLPIAEFGNNTELYKLSILGFEQIANEGESTKIENAWTLSILLVIIPIITLVTINLFKYRMLQIRLTIFNSLLMLGYYGMFFYFRYYYATKFECEAVFMWTMVIPAICIILNYLAIRGIGRDEALVKSLDRIR